MGTKTKGEFPTTFHVDILKRCMSEEELRALYERYKGAYQQYPTRDMREPSEEDRNMVAVLRETKSVLEAAKRLGVSEYKISSAALRLATYSAQ